MGEIKNCHHTEKINMNWTFWFSWIKPLFTLLLLLLWMWEFFWVVVSSNLFSVACQELLTINWCFGPYLLPLFQSSSLLSPWNMYILEINHIILKKKSYYVPIMSFRLYIIDLMEMNLIHCKSSLYQVQEARSLVCFYKCCKYLTSPTAVLTITA